jgi:iron complex transport system permease protein
VRHGARPATAARFRRVLVLGTLGAALLAGAALLVGAERVDVAAVLGGGGTAVERDIFLSLRLPRVLAGALVGAALAVCGTVFQALLRNPLAEPYLLGISGGGSFGAVLAIVFFGAGAAAPVWARTAAALAGCLLALAAVYTVAARGGALRPSTLLLAGVVANSFFLAGLACAQYAAAPTEAQAILRWVMGGLSTGGRGELWALAVVAPLGTLYLFSRARELDLLAFGEETARHLGVPVEAVRRRAFLVASLLTAACVAVSGPIGFVGLFVPHAARFLVGTDHRLLLPAAFLAGAAFLPLADALARTALAPREVPVGIVTALVGAPAFVVLLVRQRALRGAAHD